MFSLDGNFQGNSIKGVTEKVMGSPLMFLLMQALHDHTNRSVNSSTKIQTRAGMKMADLVGLTFALNYAELFNLIGLFRRQRTAIRPLVERRMLCFQPQAYCVKILKIFRN